MAKTKILPIPYEHLAQILLGELVVAKHMLPDDAKIIFCTNCIYKRSLDVVIESDAFEDIAPGYPMYIMDWEKILEVSNQR